MRQKTPCMAARRRVLLSVFGRTKVLFALSQSTVLGLFGVASSLSTLLYGSLNPFTV